MEKNGNFKLFFLKSSHLFERLWNSWSKVEFITQAFLKARHRIDLTHRFVSCEVTDHLSIVKGHDDVGRLDALDSHSDLRAWSGRSLA